MSPDSGQRLYDAAGEPKQLWFKPDIGHVPWMSEEFESRIMVFYAMYLLVD